MFVLGWHLTPSAPPPTSPPPGPGLACPRCDACNWEMWGISLESKLFFILLLLYILSVFVLEKLNYCKKFPNHSHASFTLGCLCSRNRIFIYYPSLMVSRNWQKKLFILWRKKHLFLPLCTLGIDFQLSWRKMCSFILRMGLSPLSYFTTFKGENAIQIAFKICSSSRKR